MNDDDALEWRLRQYKKARVAMGKLTPTILRLAKRYGKTAKYWNNGADVGDELTSHAYELADAVVRELYRVKKRQIRYGKLELQILERIRTGGDKRSNP